jgi:hypothetical protein
MNIKTSELTDAALNYAVAVCERDDCIVCLLNGTVRLFKNHVKPYKAKYSEPLNYSTNWEQGGPIIERERVSIDAMYDSSLWTASAIETKGYSGDTPLEAAMRCYVASKLGEEVEIPDELIGD